MSHACVICGNTTDNRILPVQEKMNGTLELFHYLHCAQCGHLHLISDIADFLPYYAGGYYSFHFRQAPAWRHWLYRIRTKSTLGGGSMIGRALNRAKPPYYTYWLRHTGLKLGQHLLDVGCGGGQLIRVLHSCGLRCSGIDPFLPHDMITPEGVDLTRRDLLQETRTFDALLFSHSLEHVPAPEATLQKAATLLNPGGCIIVRIPLCDSFAFFHYGANWFQWDAPRHINLFTRKSLALMANRCGLRIAKTLEDSCNIQFWASEEYKNGIWHNSHQSFAHDDHQTHFSRADIRRFTQISRWLNHLSAGDQATFILREQKDGAICQAKGTDNQVAGE